MPNLDIVDLRPDDTDRIAAVAQLLFDAFAHIPDWLPTLDRARAEVMESIAPDRISRVALQDGTPVGWVGGLQKYDGNVYELHPLAVQPTRQRHGIGTALVRDFEEQARQRGALTVYLGTDDEFGGTTLYGTDVYPNVLEHVARIRNLQNHPYAFYLKCGYEIVGILPDANGFGRPDIFMAKRVAPRFIRRSLKCITDSDGRTGSARPSVGHSSRFARGSPHFYP